MPDIDVNYNIKVNGLDEATTAANSAAESAQQAGAAIGAAQQQSDSTLPTILMTTRSLNAARLAIAQTAKGIDDLNPTALMYGFLNMVQVVRNLTSLTKMLKDSTGAAAGAQAVLATLTGNWWVIPVALAAGALVYSQIRSMQSGGPVTYTGLHMLHKGEYVVPAHQSLGPIFITFNNEPRPGLDRSTWLRELGPVLQEQIRRGS